MVRVNSSRVAFKRLHREANLPAGRPATFGQRLVLNDEKQHFKEDVSFSHPFNNKRKKERIATIKIWKNMIFRGERGFDPYYFPCLLIQITVTNKEGKSVYKKPIWLSVYGAMQEEVINELSSPIYFQRFDIEHFFRFCKQKLLLESYQTPDTRHEENWIKLSSLAYLQLYAAKDLAQNIVYDWEQYSTKPQDRKSAEISPSKVLRDFSNIKRQTEPPEKMPLPRGIPKGRETGVRLKKREDSPVIFKKKNKIPVETEKQISENCYQPSIFEFMHKYEKNASTAIQSEITASDIIRDSGQNTYWSRLANNPLTLSNYEIKFKRKTNQRAPPQQQMRPLF